MLGFRRPALEFAGLRIADLFALGHHLLGVRPGYDHNTGGIGRYEVAGRYSYPAGHHGYSKLRDDQTTAGRHRYRRQPVHGEAQLSMFIDIPERPVGYRARGTTVDRPDRSVTAPDRAILTATRGQHDKRARRNVIKVVSRVGRVPVGGPKLDRERQAHGTLSRLKRTNAHQASGRKAATIERIGNMTGGQARGPGQQPVHHFVVTSHRVTPGGHAGQLSGRRLSILSDIIS
jgi:hypothetical protein